MSITAMGNPRVRDHIPLEQGLRRADRLIPATRMHRQRPYSIRTRIKTVDPVGVTERHERSETIFH